MTDDLNLETELVSAATVLLNALAVDSEDSSRALTSQILGAVNLLSVPVARLLATAFLSSRSEYSRAEAHAFLVRNNMVAPKDLASLIFPGIQTIVDTIKVDVLCLAVKKVELEACLSVFGVPRSQRPVLLGETGVLCWIVEVGTHNVAIAMVGVAGNTQTAVCLSAISTKLEPRCAVLVGMAGGPDDEALGDVVLAESVMDYEFQTLEVGRAIYSPNTVPVPEKYLAPLMTTMTRVDFSAACNQAINNLQSEWWDHSESVIDSTDWAPKFRRGVIAAGAKLIEDNSIESLKGKLHGRIKAVEMEGAGFAAACVQLDWPWLVLRGICDHGAPERSKDWQFHASFAAGTALRIFLEEDALPLK